MPSSARSLDSTTLSATAYCSLRSSGSSLPWVRNGTVCLPTPRAHPKIFWRAGGEPATVVSILDFIFS